MIDDLKRRIAYMIFHSRCLGYYEDGERSRTGYESEIDFKLKVLKCLFGPKCEQGNQGKIDASNYHEENRNPSIIGELK